MNALCPSSCAAPKPIPFRAWIFAAAALAGVFCWAQIVSPSASILWDAADLHYPLQKYFADHIRSGDVPTWTPYLSSG